jgi:hypothetical protein
MNMSQNSDDIPEHIDKLTENEISLLKVKVIRKEFENVEMIQNL